MSLFYVAFVANIWMNFISPGIIMMSLYKNSLLFSLDFISFAHLHFQRLPYQQFIDIISQMVQYKAGNLDK